MKQTAVEWLCNEWLYIDQEFDLMLIDKKIYWKKLRAVQEQAKQMEKNQLIEFHIETMKRGLEVDGTEWKDAYLPIIKEEAEKCYNETYKNTNDEA